MSEKQDRIFKRYYNTAEAAEYLGLSKSHLSNMRLRGEGPKFHRPAGSSGKYLYDRDDLDMWVKGHRTLSDG